MNHAIENALGWWQSIKEMVAALEDAGDDDEAAREKIEQSVLTVEVRSLWYFPHDATKANTAPGEFRILLTTGGPALQIQGDLSEHGEPEKPDLFWQDWGTPWTRAFPEIAERDKVEWDEFQETLLTFCRCFYFGE